MGGNLAKQEQHTGSGSEPLPGSDAQPAARWPMPHRAAHGPGPGPGEGEPPAFRGAAEWLNSPPPAPAGLRGKMVLADFWAYTCINAGHADEISHDERLPGSCEPAGASPYEGVGFQNGA
jgi:hypothetical protein